MTTVKVTLKSRTSSEWHNGDDDDDNDEIQIIALNQLKLMLLK
jgi:hypothetical protein